MFVSAQDYVKRISHALEHVVVPQIDSDHARGQVLAAVFLLDQLIDRIEYKAGLIGQETKSGCETVKKVVQAFGDNAPDDLLKFTEEVDRNGPGEGLEFRDQCDKMMSVAIDFFFDNKDKLDPEAAHEINGEILKQLKIIGARNIGMLKLSTSGKLIQTKD